MDVGIGKALAIPWKPEVVGCASFSYIPILCTLNIRPPLLQDEQITLIQFYKALVRELLDLLFTGTFKPQVLPNSSFS